MIKFGNLTVGEVKREPSTHKQVIQFGRVIDLTKPQEPTPEPIPFKRQTLADLAVKEKIPEANLINTSVNSKTNDSVPSFIDRKKLRYKKSSYLKDIWGE